MKLSTSNYYSPKANREFMSASQFKDFMKCPAMAMAKLNGTYNEDFSKALLLGRKREEYFQENRRQVRRVCTSRRNRSFGRSATAYDALLVWQTPGNHDR